MKKKTMKRNLVKGIASAAAVLMLLSLPACEKKITAEGFLTEAEDAGSGKTEKKPGNTDKAGRTDKTGAPDGTDRPDGSGNPGQDDGQGNLNGADAAAPVQDAGSAGGIQQNSSAGGSSTAAPVQAGSSFSLSYPASGVVLTAVNARKAMDGASELAGILPEGAQVTITGSENSWYTLEYEGKTCYVMRKYVCPDGYLAVNSRTAGQTPDISHLDLSRPMVALTFDDGPHAESTNRILDALEQAGARATFFMNGSRVVGENNDCVKRMVADHCELGNHTYNHEYFNKIDISEIRKVVRRSDYMVEETCGLPCSVLRPPGGNVSDAVNQEIARLGLAPVLWSIDTLDWDTKNADNTVKVIKEKLRDGDIILMHDVYMETADAAVRIIPWLKEQGYQMVTVSELAAARGQTLEPGKVYTQFWKK